MIPLKVPNRSRQCSKCCRRFHPGDDYYSALVQEEERCDYCPECREEHQGYVQWHGRIPLKPKKPEPKNRDERALAWLQKAIADGEEEEAYILGLYLQRRKKLHLRRESKEKQVLELVGQSSVTFTLIKPNIQNLAIEALQVKIAQKLQAHVDEDEPEHTQAEDAALHDDEAS